jgi:hypothetical protein
MRAMRGRRAFKPSVERAEGKISAWPENGLKYAACRRDMKMIVRRAVRRREGASIEEAAA